MSLVPIRQEQTGWRDGATCAIGIYPAELWFARGGNDRRLAKQLCSECAVLEQCTASAVLEPLSKGVVAGMTPSQVRKLKKVLRHDDAA
jgi:hypothetical protein